MHAPPCTCAPQAQPLDSLDSAEPLAPSSLPSLSAKEQAAKEAKEHEELAAEIAVVKSVRSRAALLAYKSKLVAHHETEKAGGITAAHEAAHAYLLSLIDAELARLSMLGDGELVSSSFLKIFEAAMIEHEAKFDDVRAAASTCCRAHHHRTHHPTRRHSARPSHAPPSTLLASCSRRACPRSRPCRCACLRRPSRSPRRTRARTSPARRCAPRRACSPTRKSLSSPTDSMSRRGKARQPLTQCSLAQSSDTRLSDRDRAQRPERQRVG